MEEFLLIVVILVVGCLIKSEYDGRQVFNNACIGAGGYPTIMDQHKTCLKDPSQILIIKAP